MQSIIEKNYTDEEIEKEYEENRKHELINGEYGDQPDTLTYQCNGETKTTKLTFMLMDMGSELIVMDGDRRLIQELRLYNHNLMPWMTSHSCVLSVIDGLRWIEKKRCTARPQDLFMLARFISSVFRVEVKRMLKYNKGFFEVKLGMTNKERYENWCKGELKRNERKT